MRTIPVSLILLLIIGLLAAGCSQPASPPPGASTVPPAVPAGTFAIPATPLHTVPSPTEIRTGAIPPKSPLPLTKTVKDRELLFSLVVPDSWNMETERLSNPEGYEGLAYRTSVPFDTSFTILTYAITRGQDQDIRNAIRDTWIPKPNETTVTLNSITCDRFETSSGGKTAIAYVVRKASANEKGFASWITCTSTPSGRLSPGDCDAIVRTFRYLSLRDADSVPGELIPHYART